VQPGLLGWKLKTTPKTPEEAMAKLKTPAEAKARWSRGNSLFRDAIGISWKKTQRTT